MSRADEIRRAGHLMLDRAREGADIHRDTITLALKATGDLPPDYVDHEADEIDDAPIQRTRRGIGEWERQHTGQMAPATWLCGLI